MEIESLFGNPVATKCSCLSSIMEVDIYQK